jgi:hypothetical protein
MRVSAEEIAVGYRPAQAASIANQLKKIPGDDPAVLKFEIGSDDLSITVSNMEVSKLPEGLTKVEDIADLKDLATFDFADGYADEEVLYFVLSGDQKWAAIDMLDAALARRNN